MLPSAIDHIVLPVVILKNKLVDGLRAVLYFVYQRPAQKIFERPGGTIGNSNAYTADLLFIIMNIIRAKKEIILPAHFGNSGRPHGLFGPFYSCSINNIGMFCPMHQVV